VIERHAMVDGLFSSATVLLVALFWDHTWSRAAAAAAVMALLRLGYWLIRWCYPGPTTTSTPEELIWLERRARR
jgi:hypothetical protein